MLDIANFRDGDMVTLKLLRSELIKGSVSHFISIKAPRWRNQNFGLGVYAPLRP